MWARTQHERETLITTGVQGQLKGLAWKLSGFKMLSRAIRALFLSILIQNT